MSQALQTQIYHKDSYEIIVVDNDSEKNIDQLTTLLSN